MEPLYAPNPSRVSVDDANATCMDVGGALASLCARAQQFDSAPDEIGMKALLGSLNRVRTMLNMLERHALREARRVGVGKPPKQGRTPPKSIRSLI